METLLKQRKALLEAAQSIAQNAKSAERALTSEEAAEIEAKASEIEKLDAQIKESSSALQKLAGIGKVQGTAFDAGAKSRSLGEHAVKELGEKFAQFKSTSAKYSFGSTEFNKAAGDTQVIGDVTGGVPVQVDRTVVQGFRERPTVASWIGSGTMSSTSIQYYVEKLAEGSFETVAELGLKPQLHYTYDTKTDALTKIAGRIKVSDEMMDDLPFIMSEIDGRLLYDLTMFEEQQILAGDGLGTNLTGLLNRSGVQVATSESVADNLDAVYRGLTSIQTATGLAADGIIVNPTDYQEFRLAKNGDGDYYGGGPFSGGATPPLWGVNTIVTSAIPRGTVLLGNGQQAATLYRKGGVRVESTNSNEDDFNYNRVSIRAEERVALACRKPAALLKLTLATPAAG